MTDRQNGLPGRLVLERARRGHTQAQAAEAMGISRQTVSAWESGTPPSIRHVRGVAAYLGVTPDELLRWTGRAT